MRTQTRAKQLDGVATAAAVKDELRQRVDVLRDGGIVPGLGTLLVGENPASVSYITSKHRDCESVGIRSTDRRLPAEATEEEVLEVVDALNADPQVTGFIVQLPLPDGIDEARVLERVLPAKDADGLHPTNLGRLVLGVHAETSGPVPCTPAGIVELLTRHGVVLSGKHLVVIGRGITVGRPLGLLLSRKGIDATVTLAHSRTSDLPTLVRSADIVIAAVGVPHLIDASWVSPGAVVVDVGVTRVGTTPTGRAKIAGDVAPEVANVADWISPNPGGVGPMTRVMLLSNIVAAAERDRDAQEGTPSW